MKSIKKGLVTVLIPMVFGNIALADELNRQIQTSKEDKPKKPYTKNGIFLGIEGNLGSANLKVTNLDDEIDKTTNKSTLTQDSRPPQLKFMDKTTFDLGLMGGYQHYFGQSQRHGIKVSAHIYSGFGNSWSNSNSRTDIHKPDSSTDPKDISTVTYNNTIEFSYVPLKLGIDIKYLWDFLSLGKHTLGLGVGIGYELDWYFKGKEKETDTYHTIFKDAPERNREKTSEKNYHYKSIFASNFYPVMSLHYYYKRHQFELLYRFGGLLFDALGHQTTAWNEDDDHYFEIFKRISYISHQSYLTFNYAYRF